jgi:metallo-beta-lactamase class B
MSDRPQASPWRHLPGGFVVAAGLAYAPLVAAQDGSAAQADPPIECHSCAAWNEPQAPFRIFGNTYYVGTAGLSVILIDSGDGLLLLDGALPQSVPLVADSIAALGFALADVRLIALSHAHYDHAGGVAALRRASGARVVTSRHAANTLARGDLLEDDPQYGGDGTAFPAVSGAQIVEDGGSVTIGDLTLTAVYTPGHTPGGVSWTWSSCDGAECRSVVYADSLGAVAADAYRFGDGAAADISASAAAIARLDCDILLSPHPFLFRMHEKLAQGNDGFSDGGDCAAYAQDALDSLDRRLLREAQRE